MLCPKNEQNPNDYSNKFVCVDCSAMPSPLEKVVAEKKEAIEAMMEMLEKGAEVLASAVGEFFPLCEAAAPVLRLALDNVQSKEVIYVKEQFLTVRNKLDILASQLEDIDCEIKKARLDSQYFSVEENLRNQFRKYLDILEAKPQYHKVKTQLFLDHFNKTSGEKNLNILYDALMGNSFFSESILEVVVKYVARNRRILENFCVRMKELFCIGLIALLGHCALTQGDEAEQEKASEWCGKIQEVENKMKAAIKECVASFAEQACIDVLRLTDSLELKSGGSLEDICEELLHFLDRKYDWVRWSVRIINDSERCYQNFRAGKNFQLVVGQSWFQVKDMNVVVSYSENPQPLPRDSIQQLMEGPAKRGDAKAVVEILEKQLPGFVFHAISQYKKSHAVWNFPEDCHYWERHNKLILCAHSD